MCLCTRETECNNAETDFDQHITRIIYSFVEAKNLTFLLSSLWFLGWFLRRQCGQSQFKQQQRSTWQQHNIHLSSVCPLSLSGCGLIQSCDPTCLVCVCVCVFDTDLWFCSGEVRAARWTARGRTFSSRDMGAEGWNLDTPCFHSSSKDWASAVGERSGSHLRTTHSALPQWLQLTAS